MNNLNLNGNIVTLGTDILCKFAWCFQNIGDVPHICLHIRNDGYSTFDANSFITAIPLENIETYAHLIKKK